MRTKEFELMNTAVLLSTYNGEQYIYEQLVSLLNQTKIPDKVCIWDDCSTDHTVDIIEKFIENNDLNDHWFLKVNESNVGWKSNFHDLVSSSNEEIVFLCDQDDIWNPKKIEKMTCVMEKNSEIGLLACSYEPYYSDDPREVSPAIIKTMSYDGKKKKIKLDETFHIVKRPGCTYAIRKSFFYEISNLWIRTVPHDMNLWTLAVLKQRAYYLDESLVKWRRYNNSSSSPFRGIDEPCANKLNRQFKNMILELNERIEYYTFIIDFQENVKEVLTYDQLKYVVAEKQRCEKTRSNYMNGSVIGLLLTYFQYRKSYISIRSIIMEIGLVICNREVK